MFDKQLEFKEKKILEMGSIECWVSIECGMLNGIILMDQ